MTETQLRRLARQWASRLGIGHYSIDVDVLTFDPLENAADASVSPDYYQAWIRVQRWVLEEDPPEAAEFGASFDPEILLVHELLHVANRPMRRFWQHITDGYHLHRDVEKIADQQREAGEEETVDRMARALVAAWRDRSV